MNRPQSAKPGYRNNWVDVNQNDNHHQNQHISQNKRKNVKLMKPDLTTNDYGRILPKKIYQDKQRLYSQALQLKQTLNETFQQNIRLKTRITILQKQKDKLTKHIDIGGNNQTAKNNINSRINVFNTKNGQKQNMIVQNLKKMIRQSKQQNQYLKQQNIKTKKAIKYTKINQLEIERKMIQDQNKRLASLLEQMNDQLINQDKFQRQNNMLKRALNQQQEANKQLNQANLKYIQYIQQLEERLNTQSQRHQNKQNKLQRDLALNKRKMNEAIKKADQLKKQLDLLKDQNNSQLPKKGKLARPVSSNSYKNSNGIVGVRLNTDNKQQNQNKQNKQNVKKIELQNQKLKQQLNLTKKRLQQSQRIINQSREKSKSNANVSSKDINSNDKQTNVVKKQQNRKQQSSKKIIDVKPAQQKKQIYSKQNKQFSQQDQYQQDDYDQQFQNSPSKSKSKNNIQSQIKKQQTSQIDQYRKDFQGQEEEEQLFTKKQEKNKKSKKDNENDKNKGKNKKQKGGYKPDKKILSQIKQLLTYRMKAQRYPYPQLKKDIQQANQKQFTYQQLKQMFTNEPFYLTGNYIQSLLKYCYQTQKIKKSSILNHEILLTKLRKVIQDFNLIDQKQQQQMLLRIAQMVTQYPDQLQAAFENIKNGQQTVDRANFIQMFRKLQLQDKYIEIIIQQLSLCSIDLQHLNFHGFFQRFYQQGMMDYNQNGRIQEQQQQSREDASVQHSRLKSKQKSHKAKSIKKQFEDYDEDLEIDDGQKISLGNQDNQRNNMDIVSDDGLV